MFAFTMLPTSRGEATSCVQLYPNLYQHVTLLHVTMPICYFCKSQLYPNGMKLRRSLTSFQQLPCSLLVPISPNNLSDFQSLPPLPSSQNPTSHCLHCKIKTVSALIENCMSHCHLVSGLGWISISRLPEKLYCLSKNHIVGNSRHLFGAFKHKVSTQHSIIQIILRNVQIMKKYRSY